MPASIQCTINLLNEWVEATEVCIKLHQRRSPSVGGTVLFFTVWLMEELLEGVDRGWQGKRESW